MVIGRRQSVFGDATAAAAEALVPVADVAAALKPPSSGPLGLPWTYWMLAAGGAGLLGYGFHSHADWAKWVGGLGLGVVLLPVVDAAIGKSAA
jgi:hypothetical protein